jgi:hypothetical protein
MVGNLGFSKNELSHWREKPVKDYINRWNGILNNGLYNGETELVMERV